MPISPCNVPAPPLASPLVKLCLYVSPNTYPTTSSSALLLATTGTPSFMAAVSLAVSPSHQSTLDLPNHLHCPPMSINYKQVVVCPCMYPKITCSSLYLCCMRGLHHASLCIPNSYPTTSSSALLIATTGTPSLPCHEYHSTTDSNHWYTVHALENIWSAC
jgi:hypothetical protein